MELVGNFFGKSPFLLEKCQVIETITFCVNNLGFKYLLSWMFLSPSVVVVVDIHMGLGRLPDQGFAFVSHETKVKNHFLKQKWSF